MEVNIENVKEFVEVELNNAEIFANTRQEVMNCKAIAFGAILFAQRNDICSYGEVDKYWNNYAWEEFEKIAREKGKGPKVEVI